MLLCKEFPPQGGLHTFPMAKGEPVCETKSLTRVSVHALWCGASLEIIAVFLFFESVLKRKGSGENPERGFREPASYPGSATGVRPWAPTFYVSGPLSSVIK